MARLPRSTVKGFAGGSLYGICVRGCWRLATGYWLLVELTTGNR